MPVLVEENHPRFRRLIAGINGATSTGGVPVFVNASGQLGTATAATRFTDNGDGTVTDHQTGLMWEKKTGKPRKLHDDVGMQRPARRE